MAILTRLLTALRSTLRRRDTWNELDALYARAQQHLSMGERDAAISALQRALRIAPTNLVILNALASELFEVGRSLEGRSYLDRAVQLDDCFAPAVINLATLLSTSAQRTGEAARLAHRASRMEPGDSRVDSILAQVALKQGRPQEATEHSLRAWLKSFDDSEMSSCHMFTASHSPHYSDEMLAAEHMLWGATRIHTPGLDATAIEPALQPQQERKLRLGYLSGDLRLHSVAYFLLPVLECHDKERFEIYLYNTSRAHDAVTDRLIAQSFCYRPLGGQTADEISTSLRSDRLDILVELSGHTNLSALHAITGRLATVQLAAFGYPPTTGSPWIDFKLVDRQLAPPGSESCYSEDLLRLASSFWTFKPLEPTPDPAAIEQLRQDAVVFGYYGSVAKVSDDALNAWAQLLARLPRSRLLVKSVFFDDPACRASFQQRASTHGIPMQRMDLLPPDSASVLFASYAAVDVILDTFPFNGGTTTCFALWMGVPVVTLAGKSVISRMGASMLSQLGEAALITESWEQYVEVAVALALDWQRRCRLRTQLRSRFLASALGNAQQFVAEYESALQSAWKNRLEALQSGAREPVGKQALTVDELARRAVVLATGGQPSAAHRVLAYAQAQYPDNHTLRMAQVRLWREQGNAQGAKALLETVPVADAGEHACEHQIALAECCAELEEFALALQTIQGLTGQELSGMLAQRARLVSIMARAALAGDGMQSALPQVSPDLISIVVHCVDDAQFEHIAANVRHTLGEGIEIVRSASTRKAESLTRAIESCRSPKVMLLHKDCRLLSPAGLQAALEQLDSADMIGAVGGDSQALVHWSGHPGSGVVGARILPTQQGGQTRWRLQVYGGVPGRLVADVGLLADDVLLFRKDLLTDIPLDPQLGGAHTLMEIEWTVRVGRSGRRVGVVPALACARAEQDSDRQRWERGGALADSESRFLASVGIDHLSDSLPAAAEICLADATVLHRTLLAAHSLATREQGRD